MTKSRLSGRAVRALPTALVVGGIAISAGACGATNPSQDPAGPITESFEPSTNATVADARTTHLTEVLATAGFPAVVPPQTLFALADGVCRQTATGTPDSAILTHLGPTAAYAASQSGGALTADRAATVLLVSTRSDFC
ncbi:hypothetical protein C8K36_1011466 [Rhodococcus sp. OK519]|uniref:hypothetical protein n=1 Tax=Rhodococcus sp. OK519 TaxID=2135729 RepID=UPI000D38811E|nr:hypothetical protein C8K36_1011466 [Rhodococcus sp. OK519]